MLNRVGRVGPIAAALLIATVIASCDSSTGPEGDVYTAELLAANEVNPTSNATGTGSATFFDFGSHIEYSLIVNGLTAVTAAHIHGPAAAGTNAGIVVNLFIPTGPTGAVNGVIATGIITDANSPNITLDALRTMINDGLAYVNVHTSANPLGAIRGQLEVSD